MVDIDVLLLLSCRNFDCRIPDEEVADIQIVCPDRSWALDFERNHLHLLRNGTTSHYRRRRDLHPLIGTACPE